MKAKLIILLLFCRLSAGAQQIIVPENYDDELERLELRAHFTKGEDAWRRFVEHNFNTGAIVDQLPDSVKEMRDSIYVRFLVDKDGTIRHPVTTKCTTPGFQKEVLTILKKSPAWTPELQTVPVKSYVCYLFIINWVADYGGISVMRSRTPVELRN